MNNCIVSGTMEFTGGCDVIDKCKTAFVMSVLDTDCCSGCEPAVCECSPTTVNGLSGVVAITSPNDTVEINTNGQNIEIQVSGTPDYSTAVRYTGRKWITGQPIQEVVISGLAPAPGQTLQMIIPTAVGHQYINIIRSDFVIFGPDHYDYTLPIPTAGSGVQHGGQGTWTVVIYDDTVNQVADITASSDAIDLNNGVTLPYVVFGILEFINI